MSQKITIDSYVFNKTAKTVTFTGYSSIRIEGIRLITNVNTREMIYCFNDPAFGGTVSGNILTLDYDTSAMADTDKLMIVYDPPSGGFFDRVTELLRMIMDFVRAPDYAIPTATGKKIQCLVAADSQLQSVATVTTVSTLTNLTNLNNFNAIDSRNLIWAGWENQYNEGIRSKIT